jgi:hypothetical protein
MTLSVDRTLHIPYYTAACGQYRLLVFSTHGMLPHWTCLQCYVHACYYFLHGMSTLIGSDLSASVGVSTQRNQTRLYGGISKYGKMRIARYRGAFSVRFLFHIS